MPTKRKQTNSKAAKKISSTPEHMPDNELVLTRTKGGSITDYPVEFTDDSKYFFVCAESNIKVYNITTGEVVKILPSASESNRHTDKVVCVKLNPKNHLQLYSASMDGTIKLWDYNDDVVLKTFSVGLAITHMDICVDTPEYAYIITRNPEDELLTTYRYFLGGLDTEKSRLRKIITMESSHAALAVSSSGNFVAVAGVGGIAVWAPTEGDDDVTEEQIVNIPARNLVTALAFHPTSKEAYLAVGDSIGRIIIYHNCFSPEAVNNPKTMHWHEDAVRVLTFMDDGIHLMSGGNESVIVIWQLVTTHIQFLPRLGGAINSIRVSPDYKYYCVGLSDNTFQLVRHVKQKLERTIQGLHYDVGSLSSTGLVLDPRNNHMALSAGNGSILFYDVYGDKCSMSLQAAPRMQVRERNLDIIPFIVNHVAFLPGGEWMATVDSRDDHATTSELNLKFWNWDPNSQTYRVHTRVDRPHAKPITSLIFNPTFARNGPMAITTSYDGTFKVWCNLMNSEDESSLWTCRSVGEYRNYVPHCAAVSDDGSILAVGFGRSITLWDPYLNKIRTALNHSVNGNIQKIQFLPNTAFMVAISNTQDSSYLQVWNLLSCSYRDWWSCKLSTQDPLLLVDPSNSGRFSVMYHSPDSLAEKSRVVVFNATSATPLLVEALPHKALAATYIPREESEGENNIIYLHDDCGLSILSLNKLGTNKSSIEESDGTVSQMNGVLSTVDHDKTILNDLFGRREQTANEKKDKNQSRVETINAKDAILQKADMGRRDHTENTSPLSAPSHVLPSVDQTFVSFMDSLMSLRLQEYSEDPTDDMEMDEEQPEEMKDTPLPVHLENTSVRLEEFTSLNAYFAESLKSNDSVMTQAPVPAETPSSDDDEDTDEDGDPSQIDW